MLRSPERNIIYKIRGIPYARFIHNKPKHIYPMRTVHLFRHSRLSPKLLPNLPYQTCNKLYSRSKWLSYFFFVVDVRWQRARVGEPVPASAAVFGGTRANLPGAPTLLTTASPVSIITIPFIILFSAILRKRFVLSSSLNLYMIYEKRTVLKYRNRALIDRNYSLIQTH